MNSRYSSVINASEQSFSSLFSHPDELEVESKAPGRLKAADKSEESGWEENVLVWIKEINPRARIRTV